MLLSVHSLCLSCDDLGSILTERRSPIFEEELVQHLRFSWGVSDLSSAWDATGVKAEGAASPGGGAGPA